MARNLFVANVLSTINIGLKAIPFNSFTATTLTTISSLRREGQLEIGLQKAHKLRSDLSDDALLELAKEVHRT